MPEVEGYKLGTNRAITMIAGNHTEIVLAGQIFSDYGTITAGSRDVDIRRPLAGPRCAFPTCGLCSP
jgi:hypothetical protein